MSNDFLAFSISGGANVISQATYAGASYLPTGLSSGILPSNVLNKIVRQGSIGAYLCGQIINDILGVNANDDGNTAALLANFKATITALGWPLGAIRPTYQTTAATGFVMLNDGTISNAGGGGTTRANADTVNLYTLFWNNVSNSFAPVSGGRGASAAADFAALKALQLPPQLGRALSAAGAGSGLTSRALGQSLGAETTTLLTAWLPSGVALWGGNTSSAGTGGISVPNANNMSVTPTATPFSLMQPATFVNFEIKL